MYQDFFNLHEFPFNQLPNLDYYLNLENHERSLDVLNVGLEINDGIIKITGKSGTGKSMLCRLFMDKLSDAYKSIYIVNPYFTFNELLQQILLKLDVEVADDANANNLLDLLHNKIVNMREQNKRLVIIFDEAQYTTREGLEVIQILSNFEQNGEKLCHIILVGGLDLDDKLVGFQHFLQRITFSYTLKPMSFLEMQNYIYHRLMKATKGKCSHGITFTPKALKALYKNTQGIPRLVNIICHKSLMLAYSCSSRKITKSIIKRAVEDTESVAPQPFWKPITRLMNSKKTFGKVDNL